MMDGAVENLGKIGTQKIPKMIYLISPKSS
jgi:hypothetical protein